MESHPPLLKARKVPHGGKGPLIISVSKKSAPHAVTRNRIRRRIRAALARMGAEAHRPMMLVADARVANVPFEELMEALRKTLTHHG